MIWECERKCHGGFICIRADRAEIQGFSSGVLRLCAVRGLSQLRTGHPAQLYYPLYSGGKGRLPGGRTEIPVVRRTGIPDRTGHADLLPG